MGTPTLIIKDAAQSQDTQGYKFTVSKVYGHNYVLTYHSKPEPVATTFNVEGMNEQQIKAIAESAARTLILRAEP